MSYQAQRNSVLKNEIKQYKGEILFLQVALIFMCIAIIVLT